METIKTYKTSIITTAIVVAVLLGGFYVMKHARRVPAGAAKTTATSTVSVQKDTKKQGVVTERPTTVANGDAVTVLDQAAGNIVVVKEVTLSENGWVAVRDTEGRVLGAGWFSAGTHAGVNVPLLRATVAGQRYQLLLYVDDSDKQFDLNADTLLTKADGSVAGATFSTTK